MASCACLRRCRSTSKRIISPISTSFRYPIHNHNKDETIQGESDAPVAASRRAAERRHRSWGYPWCRRYGSNEGGTGLSRRVWQARLTGRIGDDRGYGVLDRLDDKGDNLGGGAAGTREALARLAHRRGAARARLA